MTTRHSSRGYSQDGTVGPAMPALLTMTSTAPWRSTADAKTLATASASVTSTVAVLTSPRPASARAVSASSVASRSQSATAAPEPSSRSAMARPIPCAPPVTTAFRPFKSMAFIP